jgi:hypothetical protein
MSNPKKEPHLLARALFARRSLDSHRKDITKQINGRVRCLDLAIDSIATHDLAGEELPLEGVDSLSPDLLRLVDDPTHGL